MNDIVLLDSGFLVALLDRSEKKHRHCLDALDDLNRTLVTCEAVIAEACYLLRKIPGANQAIMGNLEKRVFQLPWVVSGHEKRLSALMTKYSSVPMDFADACLVSMAEQFKVGDILTLDSGFEVYRWAERKKFRIL